MLYAPSADNSLWEYAVRRGWGDEEIRVISEPVLLVSAVRSGKVERASGWERGFPYAWWDSSLTIRTYCFKQLDELLSFQTAQDSAVKRRRKGMKITPS